MTEWEYLHLKVTLDPLTLDRRVYVGEADHSADQLPKIMNDLGRQGWELAAVSVHVSSQERAAGGYSVVFTKQESLYFKRTRRVQDSSLLYHEHG